MAEVALDLFRDSPRARRGDPATSHLAAASMVGPAGVQRRTILVALLGGAAIADELDEVCEFRPTTSGRRLPELERAGLVRTTGETRPTRSGREAREYAITTAGRRALEAA